MKIKNIIGKLGLMVIFLDCIASSPMTKEFTLETVLKH